jgi:chitin disaccharide deacetylase
MGHQVGGANHLWIQATSSSQKIFAAYANNWSLKNVQEGIVLYITADDFGWTEEITNRILTCYNQGRVSRCSAMTFMKDSERAAELASENGIPVGLHLNLTQEFTGEGLGSALRTKHTAVSDYLKARKINQFIFNPFLQRSVDYVFQAQWDEYCRLYGMEPTRLDGHHHMHLCMNMLASGRMPKGLQVRRNFTFSQGEKPVLNRLYRHLVDRRLKSRFICNDYFFSIMPIEAERILKIILLSKYESVELMVHPGVEKEYHYLLSADWLNLLSGR